MRDRDRLAGDGHGHGLGGVERRIGADAAGVGEGREGAGMATTWRVRKPSSQGLRLGAVLQAVIRVDGGEGVCHGFGPTLNMLYLNSLGLQDHYPSGHSGRDVEVSVEEIAQCGIVGSPRELTIEEEDGQV